MVTQRKVTPNPQIDKAVEAMMKRVSSKNEQDALPPDVCVKVINTAIAWEKVKHQIADTESFNPDDL